MRLFVILTGLAALLVQSAQAQEQIRAATFAPQGAPAAQGLQAFADTFQSCTNDQSLVEVFTGGVLGRPQGLAEQLVIGNIDVAILPASALQQFSPSVGILSAPLIFNNRRHWEDALGGRVIDAVNDDLSNAAGLRVLGYLGGEELGILSESPIVKPEDLEGRKIRVAGIDETTFSALGAAPTQMASTEVYTALQSGAVDATETTADLVVRTKAFDVASKFAMSNHRISTDLIVMNAANMGALSDESRACLEEAAETASIIGRDAVVSQEQAALAELSELGVNLNRIENRPALFERASEATLQLVSELQAEELYNLIQSSFTCPSWCDDSTCDDDECKACQVCE